MPPVSHAAARHREDRDDPDRPKDRPSDLTAPVPAFDRSRRDAWSYVMQERDLRLVCDVLAEDDYVHYYPGREAPWVLAASLTGPTRIGTLKRGPMAGLLAREPVRQLSAVSGSGVLEPAALAALAAPYGQAAMPVAGGCARGTRTAQVARAEEIGFGLGGHWHPLSLAPWRARRGWRGMQVSRPGGSLVLQVGFPADHDEAVRRRFGEQFRKQQQCVSHPVRSYGPITMSWARLDMGHRAWDDGEDLLVEEIQADWFLDIAHYGERLVRQGRVDEHAALENYRRRWIAPLERHWAEATLLATIEMGVREFGARRIWMPQAHTGVALKHVDGGEPPRSLYSALPRRFAFRPTRSAPPFLETARASTLAALREGPGPLFWCLEL